MTYEKLIDIVKGIGILLVMIGHAPGNPFILTLIYTFHMPLFFFISGYLFHYNKYKKNQIQFFRDKFQRLVIPYFFTNLAILGFYVLIFHFNLYPPFPNFNLLNSLIQIFDGNVTSLTAATILYDHFNTPSWYLVSLFCSFFILYTIAFFYERCGLFISLCLTFLFILFGFTISKNIFLPWGFDIACVAMVFMFPAYLISHHKVSIPSYFKKLSHYLPFVFLILVVASINGGVSMGARVYSNLLVFCIGGFSGTLVVIGLADKIAQKESLFQRLFIYLGKNSLIILLFHIFSAGILINFTNLFVNIKSIVVGSSYLYILVYTVSSILTIMIIERIHILKKIYV